MADPQRTLAGKTKEELLQYIIAKGNFRKEQMFQAMKFQTSDYVRSRDQQARLDPQVQRIHQDRQVWLQQQQNEEAGKAQLSEEI
jgi:hypothetical protein|mmetsp:Transcript_15135/g.18086  ORF Transcript_15135/g.18086 Transcript_15135/m.18086 type:complete len:85 (+) Transcript_15135:42-296(+)